MSLYQNVYRFARGILNFSSSRDIHFVSNILPGIISKCLPFCNVFLIFLDYLMKAYKIDMLRIEFNIKLIFAIIL